MNLTEAFNGILKAYDIGTIRTWANGKKYQKQANGKWVEFVTGNKSNETSEYDLKGELKEPYMYSLGDFRLGQPPQEEANPVKLDIGVFDIVERKDSNGKTFYSIHDPYHGLSLESDYTKEGAIEKANEKLKLYNAFSMADVKKTCEKVAKNNQIEEIKEADKKGMFSQAVKNGRMTYQEAINILKSAGVGYPKDEDLENYNPKPKKKSDYEKAYEQANIITTSNLKQKELYKYMAIAGVPKGFEGDVDIKQDNINVRVMILRDNDIFIDRILTLYGANKGVIENKEFRLKTKKYNGTEIFANQVKNAQKEGFKRIETQAYRSLGWNGYYTWLRLGYIPNVGEDTEYVEEANFELGTSIKSITELMYSQEGRDYWKKSGGSFNANFDLSENSYSVKTLNDYTNERKKQKSNS